MKTQEKTDHMLLMVVVALAAWAIPGAGHFIIKERKRALVMFLTITGTFLAGLYIGSIGVIDKVGAKPWYIAQMMASPAVGVIGHVTERTVDEQGNRKYVVYGRCNDVGQIYTSVAGMLNLLCIISAVYMVYCGRGEMIGSEEDDS